MLRDRQSKLVLYGLMAEFARPEDLVRAAEAAYAEGFRRMDAYSPMPVHGLAEAMGMRHTRVPLVVLVGAICGGVFGYVLQYFMAALAYVHNVGGRPVHSWPAFVPVTFETTVLFASLSAVVGMLAMNRLPQPYHPVFNVNRFALASSESFFLLIERPDPLFAADTTAKFLRGLRPIQVTEVYDEV